MVFGAISKFPATTILKNGYNLFNWVTRKNCYPSFWGRNIIGLDKITNEEIEYFRSNNCRIMPIVSDFSESDITQNSATIHAKKVLKEIKTLGIPDEGRIAIFVLIEPDWCVNHNWMLSYARALQSEGYIPGFIGNTDSSKNFSFDREVGHFLRFSKNNGIVLPILCATEPASPNPTKWEPFCPSDMNREEISFWQFGEERCGDVSAKTVYARDKFSLANTW